MRLNICSVRAIDATVKSSYYVACACTRQTLGSNDGFIWHDSYDHRYVFRAPGTCCCPAKYLKMTGGYRFFVVQDVLIAGYILPARTAVLFISSAQAALILTAAFIALSLWSSADGNKASLRHPPTWTTSATRSVVTPRRLRIHRCRDVCQSRNRTRIRRGNHFCSIPQLWWSCGMKTFGTKEEASYRLNLRPPRHQPRSQSRSQIGLWWIKEVPFYIMVNSM